jgi:hypothetical protein
LKDDASVSFNRPIVQLYEWLAAACVAEVEDHHLIKTAIIVLASQLYLPSWVRVLKRAIPKVSHYRREHLVLDRHGIPLKLFRSESVWR